MYEELNITTDYGQYTARFEGDSEIGYVGWLLEIPVVVQGGCIHECIMEIEKSLHYIADYEIKQLLK
jgi:hypothetical protein